MDAYMQPLVTWQSSGRKCCLLCKECMKPLVADKQPCY